MKYSELMEAAALYVAEERPKIDSPEKVADFFRPLAMGLKNENLWVANLDTKNRVLSVETVTAGIANRSLVHPREVFRPAIVANACSVIVVHNHPSGDPTPSKGDINSTKIIHDAGKILGIELIDHVIIGQQTTKIGKGYYSMRENGYFE